LKAEKKQGKKVRFESWKFPDRAVAARTILDGMKSMGSPIVEQAGVMSMLACDERGIRTYQMSKDNLLAEIHLTTEYMVQKSEKQIDPKSGKVIQDEFGNPVRRLVAEIGDVHHRVLNMIYGMRRPANGLWNLRGVMTHPIINRNGTYAIRNGLYWKEQDVNGVMAKTPQIHLGDGYDPLSQFFFAVPDRVLKTLEGIENQKPSDADVIAALETIDEFLCDFTFATESAKASAIAFMLTMICREIIDGSIPMLEVRAAEPQSGKSLLVKMMLGAVMGEKPRPFAPTFRDSSEFEKELLSVLLRGRNYVFMDNVYGKVQSSFLDMALTTGKAEKRLLGTNETAEVYSGMPFVMTANNPVLSPDIKNRVYLLDILKPSDKKMFIHKLPETYALEAGPQILRALFTLYNHWDKNEGRKLFTEKRIDGFIEWSAIIGGILQAVGKKGFLDDTEKQIKEVDPRLELAADMAEAWFSAYKDNWKQLKEILALAVKAGYAKDGESESAQIQNVSRKLMALRMVKLPGGYCFEKDETDRRRSMWRVVKNAGSNS